MDWGKTIPTRREIARSFGAFFSLYPDADVHELETHIRSESKGFSPFAVIGLVNAWNEMTHNKLDTTPFIQPMRSHYLESVDKMEGFIKKSARLSEVFGLGWFNSLRKELHMWAGTEEYTTNRYGAFITFLQFGDGDESLLREIDEAFQRVSETTGRKLSKKLRDMPAGLQHYVSTVFEILVVARFPKIVDYEPVISSGRPEARVALAGQHVLIEARATLDMPLVEGVFFPEEVGYGLASKAKEKYSAQLSGAQEPVVLFFAMNVGVNPLHVEAMLDRIVEDEESKVLSAIIHCETCHARKSELWIHPNPNFPLSATAIAELKTLFRIP